MASKQEVIALDAERRSRRERLADRVGSAKEKLAPSHLAAKISDEQKAKVRDAGRKAGQFTKDHKYAIGGGVAAVAAGAAGLFLWRRNAKNNAMANGQTDNSAPTDSQLGDALTQADAVTEPQPAPAAGSAI